MGIVLCSFSIMGAELDSVPYSSAHDYESHFQLFRINQETAVLEKVAKTNPNLDCLSVIGMLEDKFIVTVYNTDKIGKVSSYLTTFSKDSNLEETVYESARIEIDARMGNVNVVQAPINLEGFLLVEYKDLQNRTRIIPIQNSSK
jgi:hypothetical protein